MKIYIMLITLLIPAGACSVHDDIRTVDKAPEFRIPQSHVGINGESAMEVKFYPAVTDSMEVSAKISERERQNLIHWMGYSPF